MNQVLQIFMTALANFIFFSLLLTTLPSNKNAVRRYGFMAFMIVLYSILSYYILQSAYYSEGFFFQVSPKREQCLREQVEPIPYRSAGCCGKGTTGGYPARNIAKDFINPEGGWDWTRVDAFGPEASITPPTEQCG